MKYILLITMSVLSFKVAKSQNDTTYHVSGPRTFEQLLVTENETILFNLAECKEVNIADKLTDKWDIGFSGKNIILNSGGNGGGNVSGQLIEGQFFNLNSALVSGYQVDNMTNPVIGQNWILVDTKPDKNKLILLQKGNGSYAKIELISCKFLGGFYTYAFRYLLSSSRDLSQKVTRVHNLFAGNPNYTFFDIAKGVLVPKEDSVSAKWNIAFKTTNIIVNSGISGSGIDSAQMVTQKFSDITGAPFKGYRSDNSNAYAIPAGSGNGWYTYDITVHSIKPTPNTSILIKSKGSNYTKVGIVSYYIGNPTMPTFLDINTARYYTFDYFYQPDSTRDLRAQSIVDTTQPPTGVQTAFGYKLLNVYPNPSHSSSVTIEAPVQLGRAILSISDIQGRLISRQSLQLNAGEKISLERMEAGVYIVQLFSDKKNFNSKLIIY